MPEWKGRVPLTRSHCERITHGFTTCDLYLFPEVKEMWFTDSEKAVAAYEKIVEATPKCDSHLGPLDGSVLQPTIEWGAVARRPRPMGKTSGGRPDAGVRGHRISNRR
ncbi:hypothetical protein EVAR_17770_1 [Eumeta japonica]|uniref:Uncharacterized protein n=1 Tax=Eumeta variegata TaxID=151549 RepID=A0A4C1TTE1_EUMVA|nr:hypothetical protein EVAR_17770_1 [Eumeta japonica]